VPANTVPIFVLTPIAAKCRITAANTQRDGGPTTNPGTNLVVLATAGASGAFYKGIRWQFEITSTAGVIRVFIQPLGGTNVCELIKEMLVPAVTPGVATEAASGEWYPTGGIVLAATDRIVVGSQNAEAVSVWAMGGGDY